MAEGSIGREYEHSQRERRWLPLESYPVERAWAGRYGWTLRAARDLAPGEVVLREYPVASAIKTQSCAQY